MLNNHIIIWLFVVFLGVFPWQISYADEYLGLIRVTCIPEVPHFTVERVSSHDGHNFLRRTNSENKDDKKAWEIFKKNGYLSASKFDYECKLPEGVFHIWGYTPEHQATEPCGGDPRTVISMSKNGKTILIKCISSLHAFLKCLMNNIWHILVK